jgi:hypothetical protein
VVERWERKFGKRKEGRMKRREREESTQTVEGHDTKTGTGLRLAWCGGSGGNSSVASGIRLGRKQLVVIIIVSDCHDGGDHVSC